MWVGGRAVVCVCRPGLQAGQPGCNTSTCRCVTAMCVCVRVCAQAAGFTADEVMHLLCALFEQSEYRRDALARIKASAW